jgi:hypothetical protein
MQPSIAGAWELISETECGLIVATDTHVSAMIIVRDRPVPRDRPVTEADELAAYRSFIAQAGRYTITGSRLVHHRDITRDPASTGTDEEFETELADTILTTQSCRPDGTRGERFQWRKVR